MRYLALLLIFSIILVTNTAPISVAPVLHAPDHSEGEERYMIPDEAVRLRILANSDDVLDQDIKLLVRDRVNAHIRKTVAHIDDIEVARVVIEQSIPALNEIIAETLTANEISYPFDVTFKKDVSFPVKTYGPYIYPEGDYEAILITLGQGLGENWWCVLFPPLCFIDLFGEANLADADLDEDDDLDDMDRQDATEETDVEVRFFLFDLFNFS